MCTIKFSGLTGRVVALALIGLILAPTPSVHGDHDGVHVWTLDTGGNYYTAENWDPSGVPGDADIARFFRADDGSLLIVHFSPDTLTSPASDRLLIPQHRIMFNLGPNTTYQLHGDGDPDQGASLVLGQGFHTTEGVIPGLGVLAVAGGTLAGVDAVLGLNASALFPSFSSRGELGVGGGATADFSRDMYVGYGGHGELFVAPGGTVVTGRNAYLGYQPLIPVSRGEAFLAGADAQWMIGESLFVGGSSGAAGGQGLVNIEQGARLQVGQTIHVWGGGQIELDGGDSRLLAADLMVDGGQVLHHDGGVNLSTDLSTITSAFDIGRGTGTGTLTITGGGRVESDHAAALAVHDNADGHATVSGTDAQDNPSTWRVASLFVGGRWATPGGHATLNVEDQGQVHVDGSMRVWHAGEVTLGPSSQLTASRLFLNGGSVARTGGWLAFSDSGEVLGLGEGTFFGIGSGTGELEMTAGATLVGGSHNDLGRHAGSTGIATLSNPGTQWTGTRHYVGNHGVGELSIEDGAAVHSIALVIGMQTGPTSGSRRALNRR